MKRLCLLAAATVVAGLAGCTTHAKYIDKNPTKGVVAVADVKYRDEALRLISMHVGSNYTIVSEGMVPTPGAKPAPGSTTVPMELRIAYEKSAQPNGKPGTPGNNGVAVSANMTTPNGTTVQTQYMSGNAGPAPVTAAGGFQAGATMSPTAPNANCPSGQCPTPASPMSGNAAFPGNR